MVNRRYKKSKKRSLILKILLVLILCIGFYIKAKAYTYMTWQSLNEIDIRNDSNKSYCLSDYPVYRNQTVNVTQYPVGNSYFDDVQMSDSTRLQYMKKFRCNKGQTISIVGATDDTNLIGGANTNSGNTLYWSISEYDKDGNLLHDGDWRKTTETWSIGLERNKNAYGSDGYALGVDANYRYNNVAYVMVIFRWNDGNLAYGSGDSPLSVSEFTNAFSNVYICYEPFTYKFDSNGGTTSVSSLSRMGISNSDTLGNSYTFPTATRTGYQFLGWKVVSSSNTKNKQINNTYVNNEVLTNGKFYSSLFGDVTFQAQWGEISQPQISMNGSDWINTDYLLKATIFDKDIQGISISEQSDKGYVIRSQKESDSYSRNNTYIYNEVDYSLVFDSLYYSSKYSDLDGLSTAELLEHFVNFGMAEGRQASENFNLSDYKANNTDIVQAYGNDNKAYYLHYINFGASECRKACSISNMANMVKTSIDIGTVGTQYNGVDYSDVYNPVYYAINNPEVLNVFGANGLLKHFVEYGMAEGRQGNDTFDLNYYKEHNSDVRNAYGNNNELYYSHYMNFGLAEKRQASEYNVLQYNVTTEGVHNFKAQVTDTTGNTAITTAVVKIDKTAPTITSPTSYTLSSTDKAYMSATDTLSGMKSITLYGTHGELLATGIDSLSYKFTSTGTYTVTAKDNVDNTSNKSIVVSSGEAPNVSTTYTIKHSFEKADGTYETLYTENGTGNVGDIITAKRKDIDTNAYITPTEKKMVLDTLGSNNVIEYKYERTSFKLTLTSGTGIANVSGDGTYKWGKAVNITAIVNSGYTWVNWTGSETINDRTYNFTMPQKNLSFTANATTDLYNITYDLQGGYLPSGVTNPTSYAVTTNTFTLNNPVKDSYSTDNTVVSYKFMGWTGTELSNATQTVTVKRGSTGDRTYKANWSINAVPNIWINSIKNSDITTNWVNKYSVDTYAKCDDNTPISKFNITDEYGKTIYSNNDGSNISFNAYDEGIHFYDIKAVSTLNSSRTQRITIKYDITPPTILNVKDDYTWQNDISSDGKISLNCSSTDNLSGVKTIELYEVTSTGTKLLKSVNATDLTYDFDKYTTGDFRIVSTDNATNSSVKDFSISKGSFDINVSDVTIDNANNVYYDKADFYWVRTNSEFLSHYNVSYSNLIDNNLYHVNTQILRSEFNSETKKYSDEQALLINDLSILHDERFNTKQISVITNRKQDRELAYEMTEVEDSDLITKNDVELYLYGLAGIVDRDITDNVILGSGKSDNPTLVKSDGTAPTVTGLPNGDTWGNSQLAITINAEDTQSGVRSLELYNTHGEILSTGIDTIAYTFTDGQNSDYYVIATDNVGNSEKTPFNVKIDKNPPTIDDDDPTNTEKSVLIDWINYTYNLKASATDSESGIDSLKIVDTTTGNIVAENTTGARLNYPISAEGHNYYDIVAKDKAGNSTVVHYEVRIDKTAPEFFDFSDTDNKVVNGVENSYNATDDLIEHAKDQEELSGIESLTLYPVSNTGLMISGSLIDSNNMELLYTLSDEERNIDYWICIAKDKAGNSCRKNIYFSANFTLRFRASICEENYNKTN